MKTMRNAVALVALGACTGVSAQEGGNAQNEANNPPTPKITINFHDQYAPKLYDSDEDTNALLLRGVIPHKLGGLPQIFRYTLPVATVPRATGGNTTGLGDLNIIDLFLFKEGHVEIGIGPQLTIPTANKDETGTDRWQAGFAGILIAPQKWGLLGMLLTWQHSISGGGSDRPTQDNLSLQPIVNYNLSGGWYVRSTATWNFDLKRDTYAIPIGLGVGKVWDLGGGTTMNTFIEPQWTVAHDGVGQPKFQVFAGVNFQFPIGK